jgi:hypothetical protein
MRSLFASVFVLYLFAIPLTAHAQSVPDAPLPNTVDGTPKSQVVSAITGQLPGEQRAATTGSVLFDLDFSGPLAGIVARALSDGTGNTATIFQDGANNSAQVNQVGQSNVAVMVQRGSFNTSTLLQDGSYNVYGSLLDGTNNTLNVEQIGNNNGYLFGFQGSNLNHSVQQIGSNIQATQVGVGHAPFSIEQRGSNMDITIRHNGAQ